MTVAVPTFSQIKAQVAAIRQKSSNGEAIGLHASGRWTGEVEQTDGRDRFRIYQCDSPLAIRLALRDPLEPETTKILITPLSETDLDEDILLRLTKRKLFSINSWQIAKSLFGAYEVDPRLLKHYWMADLLLDWLPSHRSYPTVNSGFLDAETVWPLLLRQGMNLNQERPDLADLLAWSTDPDQIAQYQRTPVEFQDAAADWLADIAGAEVNLILQCVTGSDRPDALPIGLAAQVIFHEKVGHQLDRAIGKIEERFFQGQSPDPRSMLRWGDAAARALQRNLLNSAQRMQMIQRSDEILAEVGATDFAHLSFTSARGFDLRLLHMSTAITDFLARPSEETGDQFNQACRAVKDHALATESNQSQRMEQIGMAARLIRWLSQHNIQGNSPVLDLEGAIDQYVLEGSFLDWARQRIREGDPLRDLAGAYKQLFDQVTKIREQQNKVFAHHLKNWLEVGSKRSTLRPVETLLDTLIAPLTSQAPVLMLVLDGMAMAVCRELLTDLKTDWTPITPDVVNSSILPGLATVPSLTTTSRTSLLSGQLAIGTANTEAKGFANHPALLKACRAQHPPQLFHKNALEDVSDAVLSSTIRDALQDPQNRVIGIVINAVDDLLDKGGQINTRWNRNSIKVLSALLQAARQSGRLVILLSDHGHIIDAETTYVAGGEGARWRSASSKPSDEELHVTGSRVLDTKDDPKNGLGIIAPWSEKLRYAAKKTGYHGGLTPQEMIVPIAVLTFADKYPSGWSEAPIDIPLWWEELLAIPDESLEPSSGSGNTYADFGPLFSQTPTPTPTASPGWITSLLTSSLYQAQNKKAGRLAPNIDTVRVLLTLLHQNHFQVKLSSIVRTLSFTPTQGRNFLASAQRILNIDGHPILTFNRAEETLALNYEMLIQQFGLGPC